MVLYRCKLRKKGMIIKMMNLTREERRLILQLRDERNAKSKKEKKKLKINIKHWIIGLIMLASLIIMLYDTFLVTFKGYQFAYFGMMVDSCLLFVFIDLYLYYQECTEGVEK